MVKFILVLLFLFPAFVQLNANIDGDKNLKTTEKERSTLSYINHINSSLDMLYDSANIWWSDNSLISDSILQLKAPAYPPIVYDERIKHLNELTPIKLNYNEFVQKYIIAYGELNRDKMQMIMSKSVYYFPIFEEYLSKYGLPLELKYLAAVESALDPNAISKSGAVGLWQFMKPTSDMFDLKVSSYIDERRDVHKSTEAACRYLKYLFNTFGDWQLALAAYNGGPGTVKKAIARSGGKTDYWELRPYFTNQMQNYVPAFIAMNYLMEYHAEHNIFPETTFFEAMKTDTLQVQGPLRLQQISEITECDLSNLKALKPVYLYSYIPADGAYYTLVLPHHLTNTYIEKTEEIYNVQVSDSTYEGSVSNDYQVVRPDRNNIAYHDVISGDNFFRLSLKYNCSVPEIYEWNSLGDNYMLKVGDRLKFFIE